jgi:hypothetical protein
LQDSFLLSALVAVQQEESNNSAVLPPCCADNVTVLENGNAEVMSLKEFRRRYPEASRTGNAQ